MMHDGAFHCISYIYRVGAPSIPKISCLPLLDPTEKKLETYAHTHAHTHARTRSPLLYRLGKTCNT